MLVRCDLRDLFREIIKLLTCTEVFFLDIKRSVDTFLEWNCNRTKLIMGKRGGVPDRWEDYSNIGNVVEGTRFLAFKVPLKADLLTQVKLIHKLTLDIHSYLIKVTREENRAWGVSDLIAACPTISLVVDLTNTYR